MALFKREGERFYRTRFTINGVRIDRSTKEVNKHAAQRFEDKLRAEMKEQLIYGAKPKHTWTEAEERWLKEMKHKRTLNTDKSHFKYINTQPFSKLKVEDITRQDIENLITTRESTNVSPATLNRTLALIKAILNRAYKHWGWLEKVPFVSMRKEDNKRIKWLTRDQADLLLSYLPKHLRLMVEFTLATGLRASNVSKLKWKDVYGNTLLIAAENFKSGKNFGIPLNDTAMKILEECKGNHPTYVFVYNNKPVLQPNTKAFRKALQKASIKDFRWHDLRHTWASWHVHSGTSLQELQALGGWSDFKMVLRYAHLCPDQLQKAANRIVDKT
jgi:integrase